MSSSSAIPTRAGALPRTSPHVSSTHHRLIRQGVPAGGVVLQTAVAPPGAQLVLNFRDASSSRSTTPHPFPADSLGRHPPSQLQLSTAGCARSTSGSASSNRSAPDNPTERWNQHVAATQRKYRQLPQPPSAQQQPPLWGAGTRASPTAAAVSLRNPALPYHTGQAIARPSKSSSLPPDRCQSPLSPGSVGSGGSSPAAAMSFFARAAQRLGAPSRKKKHRTHNQPTQPTPLFPTNFRSIIANNPPPVPAYLLKPLGRLASGSSATTKVMLRVCPMEGNHSSVLNVDSRLRQLILFDPSSSTAAHSLSQRHVVPPKMFAFDAVFTAADPLAEVCAAGLVDIIQSVVGGVDGCLFCYGHARIGKTYTMLGVDDSPATLGVIPCAIDWLFRLINDQKEQTGARFSVRVSAVEITGKHETLKDLLADIASATEANGMTSPGVYLRDDPVCGTQLENQSELRAPTAERAAYFLDAAIAARTVPEADDDARNSHLLFTIHVYQYRVERTTEGQNGVAGGRSRLHLLDLGSCSKSKDGTALSLSALGTVLLALLNGQRHLPYRESKLTQLIKESMGNARSCMIAHVSPAPHAFNETLQVLQLASRVHRMRGRKKASSKMPSTSSEDSSSCSGESGRMRSGGRLRLGVRMGTMRDGGAASRVRRHLDYTSSSEQSCDTVIYVGSDGRPMSDRELTDCEGPPTTSLSTSRGGSEVPRDGSESVAEETAAELNAAAAAAEDDDFGPRPRRSLPPPPPPSRASRKGTLSRAGYGGHVTTQGFAAADGVKELKSNGGKEMWIDGPKSMLKDVEQWVDGPPEFRTSRRRNDEVGGGEESTRDDQTRNVVVVPASGSRRPSGLPQRSRKDVVDAGGPSRRRLNCTADGSTNVVDERREDVSAVDVDDLERHRADGDVTPVAPTDVNGCGQLDDSSYELPCVRPDVAEQIYDTLVDSNCNVTSEEPTVDATGPSGEERPENFNNVGSQSNVDEQRGRQAEESIQNGLDSTPDSPERVAVDGLARPSNDVTDNVVAAGARSEPGSECECQVGHFW